MSTRKDTPEQSEFRAYCQAWLAENRPEPPGFRLPEYAIELKTIEQRDYLCAWQNKCYEAGLVGAVIGRQASALEQTPQAAHRARGDAGDFLIARWRQRDELCRALRTAFVDPVEHERMKMDIQVECVAEALNERDRARLRFANCAQTSCAFSAGSEHALDEDP